MGELKLTIIEHLQEFRKRIIIAIVASLCGMIVSYIFVDQIIIYVMYPAKGLNFIYLTPPELFLAYLKISAILGICLASPISIGQVWLFLRPGLTQRERRYVFYALLAGLGFFALGIFFAYKVILPLTVNFFVTMKVPGINPMFSFDKYLSFFDSILLSFGLVFEMPIVMAILVKLGVISAQALQKSRKIAILVIFILAAFLTPPDVISQILLAVPMLLLFELSVFMAKVVQKAN